MVIWWSCGECGGATECIFPDRRFREFRLAVGSAVCFSVAPQHPAPALRQGSSSCSSKVQSRPGAAASPAAAAPCFEQSRGVTRFTYSQVYSLETDFTEPCSEHALIRGGVGKMGGELLLAFLGLLALVHGEIVGYVDVPIQ